MNIIVITGASSGLGREFALQTDHISDKIDEIWLIARRKDRLEQLSHKMKTRTRILPIDLNNEFELSCYEQLLEEKKPAVRMLINSAGYGLMGEFSQQGGNELTGMIDINCKALTKMTQITLPYIPKKGRILQIASSAAFLPQKNFAVYAASKAYVLSFSRALNQELKSRKILVTSVCPGPVDTEFFDIAEKNGSTLAIKKFIMAKSDKVVRKALEDSARGRSVSTYGAAIKLLHLISKVLPHQVILDMADKLK